MEKIFIIIVLVLAAMAMVVVEICTPTFGLLGVLAVACVIFAVYLCFTISGLLGLVATIVTVIGFPIFVVAAVKWIPRTGLGKRLGLKKERLDPGSADLEPLVGRTTTAKTTLRPSGTIRVDGKRIIATAESGMIEKGATVRIIRATGMNVVVREVETETTNG